jgi:uncharacterized repeat protein (TIGR03803 family)
MTFYLRQVVRAFVVFVASATLTGCGGGGTSSPPPPPPPPPAITATETVLYSFVGNNNGANDGYVPQGGLVRDAAGNLYGPTAFGATGSVFKLDSAGHETVLYRFQPAPDGSIPAPGLVVDSAGSLYGTAAVGGTGLGCAGCGTFFKIDSTGNETTIYDFTGQSGDGAHPNGIISDGAGNFYGITIQGGSSNCWCGAVFKVDSAGNETVLYSFTGQNGDGSFESTLPGAPGLNLVLDSAGDIFGVTLSGGNSGCVNNSGCGTVFKLDPAGHETVLHAFGGPQDGKYPANLLMDNSGNLYGTTSEGGTSSNCAQLGCGTIFKIDTTGHETVLYNFTSSQNSDGGIPTSLLLDSSGNFYGTTLLGGPLGSCANIGSTQITGCGTFFKLDSTGHETVLYNFKGTNGDGLGPVSLAMDSSGNFYGTTDFGGVVCNAMSNGCGTVFKIVLH